MKPTRPAPSPTRPPNAPSRARGRERATRLARRTLVAGLAFATLASALVAGQHAAARPDFTRFDPGAMGELESKMWRDYYDHRWPALASGSLQVASAQYGFSWWDSLRLAYHSANAARHFRHHTEDPRCLPALTRYYEIANRASSRQFDPGEAAVLELLWWRERRYQVAPQDYARTLARLAATVHGGDESDYLEAASMRTEAMAYRDARRDGAMTEADWRYLGERLTLAHRTYQAALLR